MKVLKVILKNSYNINTKYILIYYYRNSLYIIFFRKLFNKFLFIIIFNL